MLGTCGAILAPNTLSKNNLENTWKNDKQEIGSETEDDELPDRIEIPEEAEPIIVDAESSSGRNRWIYFDILCLAWQHRFSLHFSSFLSLLFCLLNGGGKINLN